MYRTAPIRQRIELNFAPDPLESLLGIRYATLQGLADITATLACAPVAVEVLEPGLVLIEVDVEDVVERSFIEKCLRMHYLPMALDVEFRRWVR